MVLKESTGSKKNCRAFFKSNYCPYGTRCQYRHEHRIIEQITRYHNTTNLIVYERLYDCSKDQSAFVNNFDSKVAKLPVFTKIHELGEKSEKEKLNNSGESLNESTDCAESSGGFISDSEMTISQYYLQD